MAGSFELVVRDDDAAAATDLDSPLSTPASSNGEKDDAGGHRALLSADTEGGDDADAARGPPKSLRAIFVLCCYNIGWSCMWTNLLVVSVPKQILDIVGEERKGTGLGAVLHVPPCHHCLAVVK